MSDYRKNHADVLYEALPEVYRERDKDKTLPPEDRAHLYKFFESLGDVLDQTRHTLEQRYNDSFPDNPVAGQTCQDWLLPYFADLFAVHLQSPYADGQRAEISNAVRWAQRKGTLGVIDEIADAVTQSEGIVQEGWKRVATTARVGLPLMPALALGEAAPKYPDKGVSLPPETMPSKAATDHPGMRAVTPDMRRHSRAMNTDASNPAAQGWAKSGKIWPISDPDTLKVLDDDDEKVLWRQVNPNGAPCLPGSYQDVSVRTPDMRDTTANTGHYHPKRVILYLPPPEGFCTPNPVKFSWNDDLDTTIPGSGGLKRSDFISKVTLDDGTLVYRNKTVHRIEISGAVNLNPVGTLRFEKLSFSGKITLNSGELELSMCLARRIVLVGFPAPGPNVPVVRLTDCLIGGIEAPNSVVQAEYVTVMREAKVQDIRASDSIFMGLIRQIGNLPTALLGSCIRFSRVHKDNYKALSKAAQKNGLTDREPVFYSTTFCNPGYGVLAPETPDAVAKGAEDSGEMGAFHAWRYVASLSALKNKLHDYLPAGITAAIVRDPTLRCPPPQQKP